MTRSYDKEIRSKLLEIDPSDRSSLCLETRRRMVGASRIDLRILPSRTDDSWQAMEAQPLPHCAEVHLLNEVSLVSQECEHQAMVELERGGSIAQYPNGLKSV